MSLASRLAAKEASQNALAAQHDNDHRISLPLHLQNAVHDSAPVDKISVDSLALSKIAKHASEAGTSSTGICLGLDLLQTLEISNAFPSYQPFLGSSEEDERKAKILRNQYNAKMCRNLHDADLDDQPVAVYMAVEYGATISETLISYAPLLSGLGKNKGFVLVYDQSSARNGNLNLRAYRLAEHFVHALRNNQFTERCLTENQLTFHQILIEFPVEIKASALTSAYVQSLATPHAQHLDKRTTLARNPSKTLEINLESPLQGNVDSLVDSVDAYRDEQSQLAFAHRHALRERSKVEGQISKLQQQRASQGLGALSEADIARAFKLPQEPTKLPSLVLQGQMDCVSRRLKDVCEVGVAMTHPSSLQGV